MLGMKKDGGADRRWSRKAPSTGGGSAAPVSVEAENLYLREELDRLRLSVSGAHRATAMVESLREAGSSDPSRDGDRAEALDDVEDAIDEAVTMRNQAMLVQCEMLHLVEQFRSTLAVFEERLRQVGIDGPPQHGPPQHGPASAGADEIGPAVAIDLAPHARPVDGEGDDGEARIDAGFWLTTYTDRGERAVESAS